MLLFLQSDSTEATAEALYSELRRAGLSFDLVADSPRRVVRLRGEIPDVDRLYGFPGVAHVLPASRPLFHCLRGDPSQRSEITICGHRIGGSLPTLIAGPCAVEDEEQLTSLAHSLKTSGVQFLRGGAYKPRSSPYDFQGLGLDGLKMLAAAGRSAGLPVITEALDERSFEQVTEYAQVVQIGARNMQNYSLLKRAGDGPLPVFLKRGYAASLEEFLLAAEYILEQGNPNLMLCERGIRTFSDHSRFTLDLAIVPRIKELSHLPIFVDPSHASGRRSSVSALALAAIAAGADGVMVEVHPQPEQARCDGTQSLTPDAFMSLAGQLRRFAELRERQEQQVTQ